MRFHARLAITAYVQFESNPSQRRVSTRALERELGTAGDELEELIEELVDVQQVARREGRIVVVTIVFADLIGSTSLHERLDPESARHVMDRYHHALEGAVAPHGGTAAEELAAAGDTAGAVKAYWVQAMALSRLAKVGASEAAPPRRSAAHRPHPRAR